MARARSKSKSTPGLGQVAAVVRASCGGDGDARDAGFRRRLVADFCKLLGNQLPAPADTAPPAEAEAEKASLAPRLRQTLDRLLAGDSEKQIALRLHISQHTVHQYVKALHKRFGVSSRGELLAKWVRS